MANSEFASIPDDRIIKTLKAELEKDEAIYGYARAWTIRVGDRLLDKEGRAFIVSSDTPDKDTIVLRELS